MSTHDPESDIKQGDVASASDASRYNYALDYVTCVKCHKSFSEEKYLDEHIKEKHPGMIEAGEISEQLVSDSKQEMELKFLEFPSSNESFSPEPNDAIIETKIDMPGTGAEADIKSESNIPELNIDGIKTEITPADEQGDDDSNNSDDPSESTPILSDPNMCDDPCMTTRPVLSDPNYVTCPICGKLFKDKKYIDKHVKLKHHDVKEAKTNGNLVAESETIYRSKDTSRIHCTVCDEHFESIMDYTHHLKVHLDTEESVSSKEDSSEKNLEFPSLDENEIQAESKACSAHCVTDHSPQNNICPNT